MITLQLSKREARILKLALLIRANAERRSASLFFGAHQTELKARLIKSSEVFEALAAKIPVEVDNG